MSATQLALPGLETYFREKWNPQPALDARIRNYLQGFAAHGREIYARRKYIAKQLGIGIRTLSRYFRHYREIGWLETVKRCARTAIREIKETTASRPIAGPSIKATPEVNPIKQNSDGAPSSVGEPHERPEGARKMLPLGYSEAFTNYIGIFYAAGKPLNPHDVQRAAAAWTGLEATEWAPATRHALDQCQRTRHVQFIPLPVNHILDRGWTRIAPPRTLPFVDVTVSRQDANQAEAARRFRLEMEMLPPAPDDFSPEARRYRERAARRTA